MQCDCQVHVQVIGTSRWCISWLILLVFLYVWNVDVYTAQAVIINVTVFLFSVISLCGTTVSSANLNNISELTCITQVSSLSNLISWHPLHWTHGFCCLLTHIENFPCGRCLCDEEVAEDGGASVWSSETHQSGHGLLPQSKLFYPLTCFPII